MENMKIWNMETCDQPGLYLFFENAAPMKLTRENIENITREYWTSPDKIPEQVKKSIDFKRCPFCPLKKKDDLCDALRPILPLFESIDKFNSYDDVTAVYKGDENSLYHVSRTSMQRALRYISNLSLMTYCRVGRKYRKYFMGINPVEETEAIANRLYLNIFWHHAGDTGTINKIIKTMNQKITTTTHNQLNRLRLICKNDAFINAFILSHMVTDMLYDYKDAKLKEQSALLDG